MSDADTLPIPPPLDDEDAALLASFLKRHDPKKAVRKEIPLFDRLQICRFRSEDEPPRRPSLYQLGGRHLSSPGNITTISAAVKSGKSGFGGAIVGAACAARSGNKEADCLGVTSDPTAKGFLLHFDTEQSREDHHDVLMRAVRRAGLHKEPDWLRSYLLTGFSVNELREALRFALDLYGESGVHSVVIDGIADFVADVNDATECNALVAELHALAIKYACPIIVMIHENPALNGQPGKTRGHLGSQLERKSEANVRLKRDGDVVRIFGEKMRKAPILESDGLAFAWSAEAGMHVTIDPSRFGTKAGEKIGELKELAESAFGGNKRLRWGELHGAIMTVGAVSKGTAESRIKAMRSFGVISRDAMGFFSREL